MSEFLDDAATGFTNGPAYDSFRPSYIPEAVAHLLAKVDVANQDAAKIVDLAAGTGKFTEILSSRPEQYEIQAVEPLAAMRATLAAKGLPRVQVSDGNAAKMDITTGWADAVIIAQAFHWFANEEALTEIHRVLKPGGKVGMIWNIEDYNQPLDWTTKYTWEESIKQQLNRLPAMGPGRFRDNLWYKVFDLPSVQALFTTPLDTNRLPFSSNLTREVLWSRINTLSQVSVLEGSERAAFIQRFNENLDNGEGEWNDRNEVAVHGWVYYTWTTRL